GRNPLPGDAALAVLASINFQKGRHISLSEIRQRRLTGPDASVAILSAAACGEACFYMSLECLYFFLSCDGKALLLGNDFVARRQRWRCRSATQGVADGYS